jgi:glycylpeptide N-tetradecanoyltransferase
MNPELLKMFQQTTMRPKKTEEHRFWDTQPVPKIGEKVVALNKQVDVEKVVDDVRQSPYPLPAGFEWSHLDVKDDYQLGELYKLLTENYVEDDDNMFRFDYSREFLQWALLSPGYKMEWHVGVRKKGELVAFISGIPAEMRVYGEKMWMAEINFLCVHKNLRTKRMAPVLIKEVTRRVNVENIWQAVYTAGVVLPKPIATSRYYHRSLNPKKLIEAGFSRLGPRITMKMTIRLYQLPAEPQIPGIRQMEKKDVPSACKLLCKYLEKFDLAMQYSEAEFEHWMLPRDEVIEAFVVTDEKGEVTDLCSFYNLPSTIIGNKKHNNLKAAYSFYNVATTVDFTKLMQDGLILAKKRGFDVFNALDIMENKEFLENLKFGIGDGHLQYYLYNWGCQEMPSKKIGLVLL